MKLNRNYAKQNLNPGGTLDYAPAILKVVTHHHDEWDEPVIDPETGEPVIDPETGEPVTEHKTRDWDTWETKTNPTSADYRKMDYIPVENTPFPSVPAKEGYHWEMSGYIKQGASDTEKWAKSYVEVANPPPPPRIFSKLKFVSALRSRDLWDLVKSYIESAGLYDLYLAAQEFKEDNAYFVQGKTALQTALGLTDEQVEEILQESILN